MNSRSDLIRTTFAFALPKELEEGIKLMNQLLNDQRTKMGVDQTFSWSHFLFWSSECRSYCVSTSINKQAVGLVCAVAPSAKLMSKFDIIVKKDKTILKNLLTEELIERLPKYSRKSVRRDNGYEDEEQMDQEDHTETDAAFSREKNLAKQKLISGARARAKRAADDMITPERDRTMNKKSGSPHQSTYQRRFSEAVAETEPMVRMPQSQEQRETIQQVMSQHQLQYQGIPQQQLMQQQLQQAPHQFTQSYTQQAAYGAPGGFMQQAVQGQQRSPILHYILPPQPQPPGVG